MKTWLTRLQLDYSGQFFTLGLLIVFLGLDIFYTTDLLLKLIFLAISIYLIFLLWYKSTNKWWIIISMIFLGLAFFQHQQFRQIQQFNQGTILKINPDDIKIFDKYIVGQAREEKTDQKISFTLNSNSKMMTTLARGEIFFLKANQFDQKLIKPATNPAQFDLQKYYRQKNIKYQLDIEDYQVAPKNQTIGDLIKCLRLKIKQYILNFPTYLKFFSGQLILAEDLTNNELGITEAYRNLGVIHLLCISGLHVFLYTKVISFIGAMFKRTPGEVSIIQVIILCLLVFLARFQPGVVRAVTYFFITKICEATKIKISGLDKLGLTIIIHSLVVPNLFCSLGAQLSYLLVLSLKIFKFKRPVLKNLSLNLMIAPLLIRNFYELNLLTLFYNMMIVPIFNFLILPLTFCGIIFSFFSARCTLVFDQLLMIINKVLSGIATKKMGLFTFGQISSITCFGVICLIFLFGIYFFNPTTKKHARKFLIGGGILLAVNLVIIKVPLNGEISFIDVGQGDSVLLTEPITNRAFLIDTGGKLNFGKKEKEQQKKNVEKITIPYLKSKGITKISSILLTHQDADHIGDLTRILDKFPVESVYFAAGMQDNHSFVRRIQKHLTDIKFQQIHSPSSFQTRSFKFDFLYPTKKSKGTNEDSLAIQVSVSGKKWLFTGDLDQKGEEEIIKRYPDLQSDYLKLGHHGSKTSTAPAFIRQLKPEIGIISAGKDNRYGHPHQETIDTLQHQKVKYLSTAEYGMITWNFNIFGQNTFKIFTEEKL